MLRTLAMRQADLLTREQCLAAGMTAEALRWRVTSRRWVRLRDTVYLTARGRDDWTVRATAALLAVQSSTPAADVAFRGRSAAYLWGLEPRPPVDIELVVPQRRRTRPVPGVSVRRSMRWVGLVDDFADPARTTVPVTVLELAGSGTDLDALSHIARAVQKRWVTPDQVRQEICARGGHRHSRLILSALADVGDGAESGAEVLYVRDVERSHGLPRGTRQPGSVLGGGRRHDNGYAEFDLVVEVDGRLGHERWDDRVRDGGRDRQLLGLAQATTRVFFPDVALTPCRTAVEIGAILAGRGWTGILHPCRRRSCVVPRPSL